MTFNVQNIVGELSKSGTARSSHFEVQITTQINGDDNSLSYRCDSAEIPGRTLSTTETRFGNVGPVAKVAYGQIYTDVTLSFILSEDLREKEFFERWHGSVMDTGAFEKRRYAVQSNSKFNINYYRDYVGTIVIRQYGSAGDLRSIHTLNEAYPIILGALPLNWSEESIMRLSVTFAYRNYGTVFYRQDQPGLGAGFAFRLDKTGLAASARSAFGNVSFDQNIGTLANLDLGKTFAIARSGNLI
jgi:hypothetical protein